MLYLLFHIGADRYALEARQAVEVLPYLSLRKIPQAERGVAGIFNFRGRPVPAIDVSELATGRPAPELLSTRIILVRYSDDSGQAHLLGLIAERATDMMRRDPREFVESGVPSHGAPYLGPVLMDEKGAIQLVRPQNLLGEKYRTLLLAETAPGA